MAPFHLRDWAQVAGAEIVAVADPGQVLATACARAFGIEQVFADPAAMLDAVRPDALDIASPRQCHADQAIPVSHLRGDVGAGSARQDRYAQIAQVSGITAGDKVTAVLGISANGVLAALAVATFRRRFASCALVAFAAFLALTGG